MVKLRTLKDLKDIDFAADTNNVIYGFSEVIKQEAIKWVKECGWKNTLERFHFLCKLATPENKCYSCKRFIEFFNITDEDLK